uniref:Integrase, catalytic region, zinc finger, CCHC-type, peptidase aspartic, catalytic n=1 Tax=Tanacetum cinerariifolium TaxID=118510 RepID=A0A6L2NBU9_TANCI|nr:integrase, catalytic region, zinc finger, CCHC-type, peptidase aspartic, catalytic [Tanacetum cinerariifolium]
MSTQQDIYATGSESHPPMLNKENYVPWSFRLLRYAKSRQNGKLIHNSILNGPYVRRMIPEPGDVNRDVNVTETFYLQTDDELSDKELKQNEADDQAIQTLFLGLLEDIYVAVDSYETAQEIWLRVQQMMKGSDIGIQEKKAKNKHFPEKISTNLKFLNNLQPEWSRHVTIVHQTKDLHTANYTQLYDFLKYNQKENVGNQNGLIGVQGNENQNPIGNSNLVVARAKGNATGQNRNQIMCYNCRGLGIQLQAEEYDLMAVAADLDEIKEVNANCILMANLQQASTSGTQTDSAPVYDTNGSTENDNDVISEDTSVEQGGETVEQHPVNFEETRALYDSLYQNLATEVEKVNSIVQLIIFIVDSGCTKHMTGNLKLLCNFVEKFLGTVHFGNDQFAPILGYGDLVQGNVTINRVYYVEGLNHNLFSIGQFYDADLEVAFRKSTCFVRDLQGNDLLTSNRGSDLYTISLQESTSSTPLCLMAKATPTQAWLWHRRLSHLNFDYINLLSKKDIMIGLPKLKLNLLHMDLCGPMRVASINGKKYIRVIVDDYSRYTWTLFLRSKDETPKVLKDFLTMIQRNLQAPVLPVRTDIGT